jgi:hypothetical protein
MASKKAKVSAKFSDTVSRKMPEGSPEERLDYLLPLYRSIKSQGENCEAQKAYLAPSIVHALKEIEHEGKAPEYVTETRRTMGMLVYGPKPIDRKQARSQMARIRNLVTKIFGRTTAKAAVRVKHSTTYTIDWEVVEKGGPELLEQVREITGMKPNPALIVGQTTKRAKTGQERKGR